MFKKILSWIQSIRPRYGLALLLTAGGLLGVIFLGGFHSVLEMTNTEAFCISCHQMSDTVYKEYTTTVHYKNASGVRASCPDCHVPKQCGQQIAGKLADNSDLYHTV